MTYSTRSQRSLAIIIIVALFHLQYTGTINTTHAGYLDNETWRHNSLTAGILNFALETVGDSSAESASSLKPGDAISSTITLKDLGSLGFLYTAQASINSTDQSDKAFCDNLDLSANLNGGSDEYSGKLVDFAFGPIIYEASDSWQFNISLPSSASIEANRGAHCQMQFIFQGAQDNTSDETDSASQSYGFNDTEITAMEVKASTPNASNSYAPIADSYVDEHSPAQNNGTTSDVRVQTKSSTRRRAFVRFDLNLPSQTHIVDANLHMFMNTAPTANRTYDLVRVTGSPWSESGITWGNQPALTDAPSTSTSTGTTSNAWLSWNTTTDVQNFVNTTQANNGWGIMDHDELSSQTYQAIFNSRSSDDVSKQPVLDMTFEVPPIHTSHIVINEVYYNVASGKGDATNNEWLELYNPTSQSMAIADWRVCDNGGCDTLSHTTPSLPPKGFAVISPSASTWNTYWPATPNESLKLILNSPIGANGLANNGDRVILKDNLSNIVDVMSYGDDNTQLNPAIPDARQGDSVARVIKGYDNDLATDWVINTTPNPGTNPSKGGIEVMRFTNNGIQVASQEQGLEPLDTSTDISPSTEASRSDGQPLIASASDTPPIDAPASSSLESIAPTASTSGDASLTTIIDTKAPATSSLDIIASASGATVTKPTKQDPPPPIKKDDTTDAQLPPDDQEPEPQPSQQPETTEQPIDQNDIASLRQIPDAINTETTTDSQSDQTTTETSASDTPN